MLKNRNILIKKMAEMLKQGATLTQLTCPKCNTPLLKLKTGDYVCLNCEKKVYVAKNEEEERKIIFSLILSDLEDDIMVKIKQLNYRLREETSIEEMRRIAETIITFLDSLEKVNKIKSSWSE